MTKFEQYKQALISDVEKAYLKPLEPKNATFIKEVYNSVYIDDPIYYTNDFIHDMNYMYQGEQMYLESLENGLSKVDTSNTFITESDIYRFEYYTSNDITKLIDKATFIDNIDYALTNSDYAFDEIELAYEEFKK